MDKTILLKTLNTLVGQTNKNTNLLLRSLSSSSGGIRQFHSLPKVFNHNNLKKVVPVPTTTSAATDNGGKATMSPDSAKSEQELLSSSVDQLRLSLIQLREQKKQAEGALKESKIKAKEEEKAAIQSLKPKRIQPPFITYSSLNWTIVRDEMIKNGQLTDNDTNQFVKVTQELRERFAKLSEGERKVFDAFHQQEKDQYTKQLEVYQQAKSKPNKLPLSSYLRFYKDALPEIKKELEAAQEKVTAQILAKIAAKKWKELDDSTKQKYKDEYAIDLAVYKSKKEASTTTVNVNTNATTTTAKTANVSTSVKTNSK